MEYVLGIDQGSTKTHAALCDRAGHILGVGRAFGACHSLDGMEPAMTAVRSAAEAALSQAGVRAQDVALLFGGLSGADWPDEYALLQRNIAALGLAAEVRVTNDCIVALRGGSDAGYGVIVIAGSGSNCAVRSPDGDEFIYHYYVEADLQGGEALGERALKAVYRAATGREPETALTALALGLLGCGSVDELLRADIEHRLPGERVRAITPLIFQAACAGDVVCQRILRSLGEGLAELVTAGLQRFGMNDLAVDVVLSGSVFKGEGQLLQKVMAARIQQVAPQARLVDARYEPIVGALLLGIEALGGPADEVVRGNVEQSSREWGLLRQK